MKLKLSNDQKMELAIIALAILFRAIFFWLNLSTHNNDLLDTIWKSESYYELANNMLSGRGFSGTEHEPFIPESWRTPLYPLFIAAIVKIFGTYWAVIITQIIVGSIVAAQAKRISYCLLANKKIALGVGVFFAIEPVMVRLSSILLTETLFLALFFAFLLKLYNYLESKKFYSLAVSAVLLGLTTLTRPITQYLPVFVIAFLIWHFRKKLSFRVGWHIVGFISIFLAILSPWLYRNIRVFESPSLAATKANNLYGYFVPSILAFENNVSYNEAKTKFFAEENIPGLEVVNLTTADHFTQRSLEIIKNHPITAVELAGLTTVAFFTHDGYLDVIQDLGYLKTGLPKIPVFKIIQSPKLSLKIISDVIKGPGIIIVAGRIFWTLLSLLALVGIVMRINYTGWRQDKFLFSILLMVYFVLTTAVVGFGVTARYRTPINVFTASFAFYAISRPNKKTQISPLSTNHN